MKQQFDVNTMIKPIRSMGYLCFAMTLMYVAAAFYLLPHDDMSSSPSSLVYLIAVAPLPLLTGALGAILHAFRSQQLEIDQLKTTVQQLQSADELAKVE